jgi:hypothetical protein
MSTPSTLLSQALFLAALAALSAGCSAAADTLPLDPSSPQAPDSGADVVAPPDAGSDVGTDAGPASPIACDQTGCGGVVGSIRIFGFSSRDEAERVAAVLLALPPSLTRAANFDVTRDAVSQTGCPDPTRTPLPSLPASCGYANVKQNGTRLSLELRDAPLKTLPLRLDHVLTDFAARDWFLGHQDEIIGTRRALAQTAWTTNCYACPNDPLEPCLAVDSSNPYVQVMRDFTSSTTVTLLGKKAWGGVGVTWKDGAGKACAAPNRGAWLTDRLVAEKPASIVAQGLDIMALCGAGKETVQYKLRAPTGTVEASMAYVGGLTGGNIIYPSLSVTATTTPQTRGFTMTYGMNRMVAWADKPFTLELVGCP